MPSEANLAAAMLCLAEQATRSNRPDLAGALHDFAAKCGATKVPFLIEARVILCAAMDELRRRGDTEAMESLETLIQILKDGQNRVILGNMNYGVRSVGQIDDALEKIRKQAIQNAGG